MKTTIQTTSVRKENIGEWIRNGWSISNGQLHQEQNPLGLIQIEKVVAANEMLRGNNQWWKL